MIMSQSDASLTREQASQLYLDNDEDVIQVLTHLWDPVKAKEPIPSVHMIDRDDIPDDGVVLDEQGNVVVDNNNTNENVTETVTKSSNDDDTTDDLNEDIEDLGDDDRREKGVDQISRLRTIADQKDTIFTQFQEDYKNKKNDGNVTK